MPLRATNAKRVCAQIMLGQWMILSALIARIVARPWKRRRRGAIAGAIGIGVVGQPPEKGIGHTGQKATGCCRHALLVAVEGAVAQAGKFITLEAKRMTGADRLRRRRSQRREASRSKHCNNDMSHQGLLGASL